MNNSLNADVLLKPYRRAGNTTRIIDNAIQILFEEGEVLIRDHHYTGDKEQNNYIFDKVLKRLNSEHPQWIEKLEIDKNYYTIKFKSFNKRIEEKRISKDKVELIKCW